MTVAKEIDLNHVRSLVFNMESSIRRVDRLEALLRTMGTCETDVEAKAIYVVADLVGYAANEIEAEWDTVRAALGMTSPG